MRNAVEAKRIGPTRDRPVRARGRFQCSLSAGTAGLQCGNYPTFRANTVTQGSRVRTIVRGEKAQGMNPRRVRLPKLAASPYRSLLVNFLPPFSKEETKWKCACALAAIVAPLVSTDERRVAQEPHNAAPQCRCSAVTADRGKATTLRPTGSGDSRCQPLFSIRTGPRVERLR